MACECRPTSNTICGGQQGGISVTQPTCQQIPEMGVMENPFFDAQENRSYFSYSLVINCLDPVTDVYFLVCEDISTTLVVEYALGRCQVFVPTEFTFENPPGILPPEGFQYIHVVIGEMGADFGPGVVATFRLSILGNFINGGTGPIVVISEDGTFTFDNGYDLPTCPAEPRITVTQQSLVEYENNTATIFLITDVVNTGNVDLENIMLTSNITYDSSNLTLGTIRTEPEDVTVTITNDLITFEAMIASLARGEDVQLVYEIPIVGFAAPNTYTLNSMANATTMFTIGLVTETIEAEGTNTLEITILVSRVLPSACCIINGDEIIFRANIQNDVNSPALRVNTSSMLQLRDFASIEFLSFSNCTATFPDGSPVPLNQILNSNEMITITCLDQLITSNATIQLDVIFRIRSIGISFVDPGTFDYSLSTIELVDPDSQILLPVTGLPATASVDVFTDFVCDGPCT